MTRKEFIDLVLREGNYKGSRRELTKRLSIMTDKEIASISYLDAVLNLDVVVPYDPYSALLWEENPFLKLIK